MGTWLRSRTRLERWFVIAVCVLIPVELALKARAHTINYGDFNVQRDFGGRFLRGEPLYRGGNCFNYMPISALAYAPLAVVPLPVASLARTLVALGSLVLCLHWLAAMTRDRARPGLWRGLSVAAVTIVLCSQYLLRDLDDGGPHLFYLAVILGSLRAIQGGRSGLGAAGFGLVIALKMTPGLLLPFLAWKRQWRLLILTGVATGVWILLPSAWMGPARWWQAQSEWNAVALNVFTDRLDKARADNEVRVQNQSLKPAVTRWLVTYPPGHPLRLASRWDAPVGHLRPEVANRVANLAALGLLVAVGVWSRRRFSGPDDPRWGVELAAVLVLMPLLSPVTWLQHLVWLLPAVYLLVAEHQAFRPLNRSALAVLGAYAVVTVVLNRGLIGRDASLLLFSWHAHVAAMLGLLGLLMAVRPTLQSAPEVAPAPPGEGPGRWLRGPHGLGQTATDRRAR